MDDESIILDEDEIASEQILQRKRKAPVVKTGTSPADILKAASQALATLREKCPLVQCITNHVTSGFVADALLALGASPVMTEDMGESTRFTSSIDAMLVNTGTITKSQSDAMRAAVASANMGGKPWTLDPVAVGALPMRTFICKELVRRFPAIIRGNPSEIAFLAGSETAGHGVDTLPIDESAIITAGTRLAGVTHSAVIVSGAKDYVAVEGAPVTVVANGSPMMTRISGSGCVQGAIAAAFTGALGGRARWESALAASIVVGIAGEMASSAKWPGSFRAAFLDALAAITPGDVVKRGKVSSVK